MVGIHFDAVVATDGLAINEEIATAIEEIYRIDVQDGILPRLVEFGSWIGGDQDGNPNVTHESAEYALD